MLDCSSSSSSTSGPTALACTSDHDDDDAADDSQQTNKTCNGYTTPQQQQHQHQIDNSIFNTISKIVNPTQTKVPEIHDFKIVKPISRGAFGKVFLGHKKSNPEQVYAIKVMKKNEMIHKNMASQVVIERNALALVRSPYCVQLFYSLQSATSVYLVMEYMVGGDLKSLLGVYGFMEESMAAFYTAEISLALEYLHSHGIVHRDLKPDNMLLSKEGHVKLTDFGLSKITTTMHRDLEISDLVNSCNTPSLCTARTPGQLLSLTSHLTFDYSKSSTIMSSSSESSFLLDSSAAAAAAAAAAAKCTSGCNPAIDLLPELESRAAAAAAPPPPHHSSLQQQLLIYSPSSTSSDCDYSRVSGVSPFQSAEQQLLLDIREDNNVTTATCTNTTAASSSSSSSSNSSYHTCEATSLADVSSFAETNNNHNLLLLHNDVKENQSSSSASSPPPESDESTLEAKQQHQQLPTHHLVMTSPLSRSTNRRRILLAAAAAAQSSSSSSSNRGTKRKRKNGTIQQQHSTGLTREICLMDLEAGSGGEDDSTPKKKNQTRTYRLGAVDCCDATKTPPQQFIAAAAAVGVQQAASVRVAFSTPVSAAAAAAAAATREEKPILLKSTRFNLPSCSDDDDDDDDDDDGAGGSGSLAAAAALKTPNSQQQQQQQQDSISPIKTPAFAATTPYRTPKSVRRGAAAAAAAAARRLCAESDDRILGTPDYLAPELLLRKGHGPAVDWWALGVCLYEFCTGVPPFNDDTPQAVFANILSRELQWPEGEECLTTDAMEAIDSLLTLDQSLRPAAKQVRGMKLFRDFPWHEPLSAVPPFVPQPDDNYDTCYFQARNILQHLNVSSCDT